MTPEQIIALVATGESEILEFKETTRRRREAAQTMCAMLNHRGGRVLFGVTPEGSAIGQQVSDHTLEEVSAEIQEIEPPVFPVVERVPVEDGCWPATTRDRGYLWLRDGALSTQPKCAASAR